MSSREISPLWKRLTELTPGHTDADRVKFLQRQLDVEQPTVSRWKTGAADIGRKSCQKLAQQFDVNVLWLRYGQGPKFGEDDDFINNLRQEFDALDDASRHELKTAIMAMLVLAHPRDRD